MPRLALALALTAACDRDAASPRPSQEVSAPPPASPPPVDPPPRPQLPLDAYLAAIPAEPPTLSDAVTGTASRDSAVTLARCRQTGWSYSGCEETFPQQGLQWVRWACMHDETAYTRSVLCTRLAEYLFAGIGGPADRPLASALFVRQCRTAEPAYRHNCYSAAGTLMFVDVARAREFIQRGCDSPEESPMGCNYLRAHIEAGMQPREFVVKDVTGLRAVAVGGACKVWMWTILPGTCGARVACGDAVLYGARANNLPCSEDGTANEDMTNQADGDPTFVLTATTLTLRDDSTGPLGAFTLTAELR